MVLKRVIFFLCVNVVYSVFALDFGKSNTVLAVNALGNRDDNEDNARRGAAAPLEAEGDNRRRIERINTKN